MSKPEDNGPFIRLPVCDRSSDPEELYALLYAIRVFEQSVLEMFDKGIFAGTTHTCLGQETTAVGVISALDRRHDIVFSNHRGHGHFLAYCGEVERLYLELMGKPDGVCAGRGGSQHLHFNNFFSSGIQGGIVPVLTGMALAEKINKSRAVSTVFLGDGTLGQGVVYESFNIASLWRIPVLFIIDNNAYAQSTPSFLQVAGSMRARPEAFGIPVEELAATDLPPVLKTAGEVVDAVREEGRPFCLLLHTYRLGPHSKGDDHRDSNEIEAAWAKDPLKIARGKLNGSRAEKIETEVSALVYRARDQALRKKAYELEKK